MKSSSNENISVLVGSIHNCPVLISRALRSSGGRKVEDSLDEEPTEEGEQHKDDEELLILPAIFRRESDLFSYLAENAINMTTFISELVEMTTHQEQELISGKVFLWQRGQRKKCFSIGEQIQTIVDIDTTGDIPAHTQLKSLADVERSAIYE